MYGAPSVVPIIFSSKNPGPVNSLDPSLNKYNNQSQNHSNKPSSLKSAVPSVDHSDYPISEHSVLSSIVTSMVNYVDPSYVPSYKTIASNQPISCTFSSTM